MTAAATDSNHDTRTWASYSQLTTHRKCPQSWLYGYRRRLERLDPDDIPVERDFGIWWHMLMAADSLERGRQLGSLRWVPESIHAVDGAPTIGAEFATVEQVLYVAAQWWANAMTTEVQAEWLSRLGEALPVRLANLYARWVEQHAEERRTEHPLAVEMRWKRALPQLPGPDGSRTDPNAVLVGYVDEVYLDTRRQMVVVRDHKTAKALSSQTAADDMMDSQLQLYAWGASPEITQWEVGPVRATAYDRVRSIAPKPPALTMGGRLSLRGGEPLLGQVDLATYLAWTHAGVPYPGTKKDGSGAGIYEAEQAVIEKLSTPAAQSVWFQRTLTPLNANLIRAHLRAAVDSAHDLGLSLARSTVTGEAARNLTANCRYCDFVRLCRAEMVGGAGGEYELSDFRLRERPQAAIRSSVG